MFWHLANAGGTQIRTWLLKMKVPHWIASEHTAPIHKSFKTEDFFRIGLIREPCQYHSSEYLWGRRYGAHNFTEGLGSIRYALQAQGLGSLYETDQPQAGYKEWLKRLHHQDGPSPSRSCGTLGMRIWTQLLNRTAANAINQPGATGKRTKPPCPLADCALAASAEQRAKCQDEGSAMAVQGNNAFDCWLRTEWLAEDFVTCMGKCNAELAEKAKNFLEEGAGERLAEQRARLREGPSCEQMHDAETAKLVYRLDGGLARRFGYTGCCKPHPGANMPNLGGARQRVV